MKKQSFSFVLLVALGVSIACGDDSPAPMTDEMASEPNTTSTAVGDGTNFEFDPTWPKPLPNNWTLGNVVGVDVDSNDHIWIVQRPLSLNQQESALDANPPLAEDCCRAAPPVIEFNQDGDVVQAWG